MEHLPGKKTQIVEATAAQLFAARTGRPIDIKGIDQGPDGLVFTVVSGKFGLLT